MWRRPWLSALLSSLVLALPAGAGEPDPTPLLVNPDLVRWLGDRPEGWSVTPGAMRSADGPEATLAELDGGGLALEGVDATHRWPLLAQRVAMAPSSTVEASFDVRLARLGDGSADFASHYVAVLALDASGKVLATALRDVWAEDFVTERLVLRCPADTTQVELRIFLSRVGRLEVKRVRLRRLAPADSLEVLAGAVARLHPGVADEDVRWDARVALVGLGPAAIAEAETFLPAAIALLGALRDEHVVVVGRDGRRHPTFAKPIEVGFSFPAVRAALESFEVEPSVLLSGTTPDGLAYVLVDSLPSDARRADKLEKAARNAVAAPGLLVDLRTCSGGDEQVAQRMVRWWADRDRVYARTETRSGPDPTSFVEVEPRRIGPPDGYAHDKPIVVLLGPGCVSSGEGLALMLRSLPHAKLVGRFTRGSSGNPQPIPLPNGLTVLCSTWRTRLPDGAFLEDVGVPPDVRVEGLPTPDGRDPQLEAALVALRQLVAERAAKK
ncbi:MAG: S41 family peptidase [Planctomycetota bacterium]